VRYGGHTSCVALTPDGADAPALLLDAGTGLRRASALCSNGVFSGTILLSHLHWDHLHGLPFFSAADRESARTDVIIPDQRDGQDAVEVISRGMSPPHFPVRPDELRGRWSFSSIAPGEFKVEGFRVVALEIPHKGGVTFGYRVSDGHSSLTYMPDHYPSLLGLGDDGWGEYHPAALELADETDVLVHDSQLVAEELEREAWFGHAAAEYSVGLARRASARHTALFHYKPDRSDDAVDEIAQRFAGQPVTASTQSLVLDL
jgi:ribonuclease BN (tRNA processing enzyme)